MGRADDNSVRYAHSSIVSTRGSLQRVARATPPVAPSSPVVAPPASEAACGPACAAAPAAPGALTFPEIFATYAPFVWRALLGLGVREADVADASQQTFLVVHGKLDRVDPTSPVRTFIYAVCLRVAADWRRRAHVRRELLVDRLPDQRIAPTQESHVASREGADRLLAALDRMDPAQREVFVLYELEELDMSEVARAVSCPLPTAYSRLRAARRQLAAAYGDIEERD